MTNRSVWWEQGQVRMIDQRQLPLHYEIANFDSVEGLVRSISDMYVRGAPAIGATSAYGMALAARLSLAAQPKALVADLKQAKQRLDAARPTAVNLAWASARLLALATELAEQQVTTDEIRAEMLAEAERLAEQDIEINQSIGRYGAAIVPQGAHILHHCNTGSLATVYYGTALGVVRAAHAAGKGIHVWGDETRPRLQGARLTAWELMREDIPMHLIADNAAGLLMRTGKVNIVLFGADRVASNGDVANKIGAYNLAVLAKENGISCYAAVPTPTIDLDLPDGDHIPIEERRWDEVATLFGKQIAPDNVPVYNPAFDITPHRYLTGIITDEGICYPPFTESLRRAKLSAETKFREVHQH